MTPPDSQHLVDVHYEGATGVSPQGELGGMPARVRRVVRAGAGGMWGADPSTKGVSVSWALGEVATERFPERSGSERLSVIYAATFMLARGIVRDHGAPGLILLEQPSGQPNRELEWACAVISLGLHDGALAAGGVRPVTELVVASKWKRDVVGFGGFGKPTAPQVRAGAKYMAETWALAEGYTPASWDEADALAIRAYADLAYDVRVR